ncbi:MAG: hypothetical protein FD170_3010 [Bacteroidetes bacterium]|nr:MAG: hypothetical protein FD170_3010 [Bacteroidota bacterium]
MKKFIIAMVFTAILTGCATYITTTNNLQSALEKGKPEVGKTQIKATDKNGKEVILGTSLQSGIRITKNDNTRQTFYFVTASLQDSMIIGSKSAIFNIPIKPIKVADIKKIELDGR